MQLNRKRSRSQSSIHRSHQQKNFLSQLYNFTQYATNHINKNKNETEIKNNVKIFLRPVSTNNIILEKPAPLS